MSKTKDAVTDFLQLGAKYELILVGLHDELNQQQLKMEELSVQMTEHKKIAEDAAAEVNLQVSKVDTLTSELKRQQTINILFVIAVAASVLLGAIL